MFTLVAFPKPFGVEELSSTGAVGREGRGWEIAGDRAFAIVVFQAEPTQQIEDLPSSPHGVSPEGEHLKSQANGVRGA
jgi:hypothetical protein